MVDVDVNEVSVGDIINVNSSEGDRKTLYVKSVDSDKRVVVGIIMCRKYTEEVSFDNIINIIERTACNTGFISCISLGKETFI